MLSLFISVNMLVSQALFARTYGVSSYAYYGVEGLQTSDGGYIISGYSNQPGAGDWDLLLLKLNSDGTVNWAELFGGSNDDAAKSLLIGADGYYVMAGHTLSYGSGDYDLFVLKTSSSGSLQWARAIGGSGRDRAYSVVQNSGGSYAVAGWCIVSNGQGCLLVLNSSGGLQWAKHYGGSNADAFFSVINTTNSGYAVVGETNSAGAGSRDVLVMKMSSDGSVQWAKAYGRSYEDIGLSIINTADGGYAVAGSGYALVNPSSFGDLLVIKLNSDGSVNWARAVDWGCTVDTAVSIVQLSDGGFLVSGKTSAGAGYRDIVLLRFSSDGTLQWSSTIGASGWDSWYEWDGTRVISTAGDGRYLITGNTNSSGPGSQNILFFKIGSDGSYTGCLISRSPTVANVSLTTTNLSWSANDWSPTVTNLSLSPSSPNVSTGNFCSPVYSEVEELGGTAPPRITCRTSRTGLIFTCNDDAMVLNIYSYEGRLIYAKELKKGQNRITLGQGVYIWKAGPYKGKAVVR
ncbi:MAG: hypothetical protein ACPL68_01415 [Candidatus Hydrothermia bacterium]